MKKTIQTVTTTLGGVSSKTIATFDTITNETTKHLGTLETYVAPTRENFASKYPGLFALLVTFGVVATFLGLEQILLASAILERYPFIILALGVSILTLTGTLYKKLR